MTRIQYLALPLFASAALLGACTPQPSPNSYSRAETMRPQTVELGSLQSIRPVNIRPGETRLGMATGAVLGGIVGAVAGRQISDRTGGSEGNKNVATVAGAVAGAAAGNASQNRTTGDTYNITVRMDDGRRVTINQHDLGGVRENTYVRIQNGRVVIR